jgi:hypothetical protein
MSEAVGRLTKNLGIKIGHRPSVTLQNKLTHIKDKCPKEEMSDIVYKIPCENCPAYYVGQSSKSMAVRLHQHKLALRRVDNLSQVAMHAVENNHTFSWQSASILGRAPTRKSREFLESFWSGPDSINRHIDLDDRYKALRDYWTRKSRIKLR